MDKDSNIENIKAEKSVELIELLDQGEDTMLESLKSESVTETITNYLHKYNINLQIEEYWNENRYKDCLIKHIHHEHSFFNVLTFDYYIREIMLTNRQKSNMLNILSDFDMGNHKKPPKDLCPKMLIDDIQYTLEYIMKPEQDGEDLSNNIRKKLFQKSGVLKRFEEISKIDLSTHDDQYSVYKLLKLLYKFSKTDYYGKKYNKGRRGKINIYSIFQKPSFYNLDLTQKDEFTDNNGKYIALFKNELFKEISLSTAVIYRMILVEMLGDWNNLIISTQNFPFSDNNTALRYLDAQLQFVAENHIPYRNLKENSSKLFVTVYFWILQQECRCVREEFLKINTYVSDNLIDYSHIYTTRNGEDYIPLDQLKPYIQNYTEHLSFLITAPNFSRSEAMRLIEVSVKKIPILWKWLEEGNNTHTCCVPSSFILASLLALRDAQVSDEKEKHSHYFASIPADAPLISRINNLEKEDTYYRYLWIKKISYIQMCISYPENMTYKLSIENSVFSIMLYLFSINDVKNFDMANKYFLSLVRDIFSHIPMN